MSSRSRIPRRWTKTEDAILSSEAESQLSQGSLRDWSRIAAKLPGRTNKDCRKRWTKICTADLKKGAWSFEEDDKLRKAVSELGQHWTQVAQVVGTRHADQCAKRWNHSLDPKLDHSKWTPELDELLVSAIAAYGRVWKTIGEKNFPSRSATDLKNRYLIVARRQKLQLAASSKQSTPGLSISDASSSSNQGDNATNMAHGASPTSTFSVDHSDDGHETNNSRVCEQSNQLITDFPSTEQMWLSSPNTPGSCDITFAGLSTMDTPGSEISASVRNTSIISLPFPEVETDESFITSMDEFGFSSAAIGKTGSYEVWDPPNNTHAQLNCLPSSSLVKPSDYHVTNIVPGAPCSPAVPSYSPNPFSYNDIVTMPQSTDIFSNETSQNYRSDADHIYSNDTDHIFADHVPVDWQVQQNDEMNMEGIDLDMNVDFDFIREEKEMLKSIGTENGTNQVMTDDGSDAKEKPLESPLNTMILEDVHPEMVRDLMGVLLRSKERVKMRMYSQE